MLDLLLQSFLNCLITNSIDEKTSYFKLVDKFNGEFPRLAFIGHYGQDVLPARFVGFNSHPEQKLEG